MAGTWTLVLLNICLQFMTLSQLVVKVEYGCFMLLVRGLIEGYLLEFRLSEAEGGHPDGGVKGFG